MKRILLLVVVVFLLFGCSQQSDDYLVKINGEKIYDEQLSIEIDKEINELEKKGVYVSRQDEKEIKEKLLDSIVKRTLLLQEAKKGDYLPTDEKIDKLFQNYLNQIPEGLTAKDFYEITEEQLYENIAVELQIKNYVIDYAKKNEIENELTVTDEEIKTEFEKFKDYLGAGNHMQLKDYYYDVKDVLKEDKLLNLKNKIANILIEGSEIVYNN